MKAPEKVYLHKIRDEESSGFHKMWFEQRARCVPSEEYIRKDALIEILQGYSHPLTKLVMQEIIDKINSL
jgi:hypothetical protein